MEVAEATALDEALQTYVDACGHEELCWLGAYGSLKRAKAVSPSNLFQLFQSKFPYSLSMHFLTKVPYTLNMQGSCGQRPHPAQAPPRSHAQGDREGSDGQAQSRTIGGGNTPEHEVQPDQAHEPEP